MTLKTYYSDHLPEATLPTARAAIAGSITDLAPLRAISDADAARPTAPGKWSRKELLGHLIDSAHNNTQRFVRAQIPAHLSDGVLRLQGYAQDDWVRAAAYAKRDWAEIIELWAAMNRHILHVIDNYDAASLATPCVIGDDEPLSAEHLIVDYAGHLLHHYKQITA